MAEEEFDALGEQINEALEADSQPSPPQFPAFMSFSAEHTEIPPEESRYILVAHKNCFPEKNIFSYEELKDLLQRGIQVTVKK